jgi:hypothetical protein
MDGATRIEKPVITREWRRTFADVPVTFARAYDTMAILPDYHDSGTGILPAGQWLMFSDVAGETGHSLCDLDDPSFAERHCLPAGRVERVRPWCSATRLPKVDSGATSQCLNCPGSKRSTGVPARDRDPDTGGDARAPLFACGTRGYRRRCVKEDRGEKIPLRLQTPRRVS